MTERRRLSDLDLNAHLRRRTGSQDSESNIDVSSFVASVANKIQAAELEPRPSRLATSRRPAFAGLAALLAILAILLVAMPRIPPTPASTHPATISGVAEQ